MLQIYNYKIIPIKRIVFVFGKIEIENTKILLAKTTNLIKKRIFLNFQTLFQSLSQTKSLCNQLIHNNVFLT